MDTIAIFGSESFVLREVSFITIGGGGGGGFLKLEAYAEKTFVPHKLL